MCQAEFFESYFVRHITVLALKRTKREKNFPEDLLKDKHIRRECVAESCGIDEFFTIPPFKYHRDESIENRMFRFTNWKFEKYAEMGTDDRKFFAANYPDDKFTANYTNEDRQQLKMNITKILRSKLDSTIDNSLEKTSYNAIDNIIYQPKINLKFRTY